MFFAIGAGCCPASTFVIYIFGAFLIFTAVRLMLRRRREEPHPEQNPVLPAVPALRPAHVRVRRAAASSCARTARPYATPLLMVLVLIERPTSCSRWIRSPRSSASPPIVFIVCTSNIFAVLGMRALCFLLANLARRFIYLQPGLALVLAFVGVKMAARDLFHLPVALSLLVVMLLIGGIDCRLSPPNPWYAAGMASRLLIPVAVTTRPRRSAAARWRRRNRSSRWATRARPRRPRRPTSPRRRPRRRRPRADWPGSSCERQGNHAPRPPRQGHHHLHRLDARRRGHRQLDPRRGALDRC